MSSPGRNKVFISYSHKDKKWLERLQTFLRPLERDGRIEIWADVDIKSGAKWDSYIKEALNASRIAILLISPDYLASDFLAEIELPEILKAVEQEGLVILPVHLSYSAFTHFRNLSNYQSFNDPSKPLNTLPEAEINKVMAELAYQIEQILSETPSSGLEEERAPIVLERVEIRNFKTFETLDLDFTPPSSLNGNWTCIAGINGAGKTTILQAICLLLLGDTLILELGGSLLNRMLRQLPDGRSANAELKAFVREGSEEHTLILPLSGEGVDITKLFKSPYDRMSAVWKRLQQQMFVSFGVTRNLSDHKETRHKAKSRHVQRQMTLFDPFTQIASVDVLLEEDEAYAPVKRTLFRLLEGVLSPDELTVLDPGSSQGLRFMQAGVNVGAIDLPDGFRSTIAWLTEMCMVWHETAPTEDTKDSDPSKMTGIVLLDEIDLHLHPSLQRTLVPRLRKALPNVQFIVTTHSPLILSSFDQAELVVLDRAFEGGKRPLDRQIFGFTSDQVYEWLMNTPAQSTVLEEKLEQGDDPKLLQYLYQSDRISEQEATKKADDLEDFLKSLEQKS